MAPKKVTELPYNTIIQALEDHLCPKRNVLVSQHKFLSIYQQENESIAEYVTQLRSMVIECNFISPCECKANIADVFLRAQFIRGVKDNSIREKLLQTQNIDFKEIVEKAVVLEASKSDSREIRANQVEATENSVTDINRVTNKNNLPRMNFKTNERSKINFEELGIKDLCIRCARRNHRVRDCRVNPSKLKCYTCGKKGHVEKVCIQKLMRDTNQVSDDETEINQIHDYNIIVDIFENKQIDSNVSPKYFVTVQINGKYQKFEVDSGVGYTLIPKKLFENLNLEVNVSRSKIAFRSYTKNVFVPDGVAIVQVKYGNRVFQESMYIVSNEYSPLLGRSWIRKLKINLHEIDNKINKQESQVVNSITEINDIRQKFPEVFTQKIGCVPNIELNLRLRENAKPVFMKAREIPYALKEKVDQELEMLEKEGIISKIDASDWGSPLVVIPKADGGVRLCVDYKASVNPFLVSSNYPFRKTKYTK
ncbi:uncharacterized protein K02A2.6-like [Teleopsis dalmanni]|uniref:uncharacterized protein K02A2.6-like n=1 Tax=Teleopsis dalmanni TaxID=139649 RepID=UPI0018CC8653|nr:uncharacterized protein K02A2.6-like [Teleopsis dalmanni]